MNKTRSALALIFALLLCLSLFSCNKQPQENNPDNPDMPDDNDNILSVYVTAGANENGADGTAEHPYNTLEAARDAIRAIGNIANTEYTQIRVVLSGRFYRSESFVLEKQDSGTDGCPIIWMGGETGAVITGAVEIPRSAFTSVTDDPFAQHFNVEIRDKILTADLKKFGADTSSVSFGEYTPGKILSMNSLFCGDTRLELARYPDNEFASIINPINIGGNDWTIGYSPEHNARIGTWDEADTVYSFAYPAVLWGADFGRIKSFDIANSSFDITTYDSRAAADNMPFYWYNVPEELTVPGEYYITEDAVVYYYPLTDDDWTLTYPVFRSCLFTADADFITLKNISFEDCADCAFKINGDSVTVDSCSVRRSCGFETASISGSRLTVKDSEFCSMAFRGLTVKSGDANTLTDSGSVITNNYFHDFSQSRSTYCSALDISGCGITVSHNEFAYSNHQALSLGGHNHVVEYNEFHDVCDFTDDAGAIYFGRSFNNYGNIFRYNYLHDIGRIQPGDPLYQCGASGIYWDGGEAGQTAYGNIFVNITGQAQQASGGPDITIKDGLYINCYCAVSHPQIYYDLIFENNYDIGFELISDAQKIASEHPEIAEAFPTILQMNNSGNKNDPWYWVVPARCTITGNVVYNEKGKETGTFDIGAKVKQWGTVKDNRLTVYAPGEQPDIKTALADSGLDIPFDEIGRK